MDDRKFQIAVDSTLYPPRLTFYHLQTGRMLVSRKLVEFPPDDKDYEEWNGKYLMAKLGRELEQASQSPVELEELTGLEAVGQWLDEHLEPSNSARILDNIRTALGEPYSGYF